MTLINIRNISFLALASAGLGVVLMGLRAYHAISFTEPLQLATSGAEYESLYVLWKYLNGLTLYVDHHKIPFAGTFYNWLYYGFYGEILKWSLISLSLGDEWIPTVTRLISSFGMVFGTWASYQCFCELGGNLSTDLRRLSLAFALFLFFGPLMGFFGIATAPDIWGVAFDLFGVYLLLHYFDRSPVKAIVFFCLFAYVAWSFKQIFVFTPGAVGIFLLLRRDWKLLGLLIVLMWGGWFITLVVGGEQYAATMLNFGGTKVTLESDRLFLNLNRFLRKTTPITIAILALMYVAVKVTVMKDVSAWIRQVQEKGASINLKSFAVIGLFLTAFISIPASAKQGASEIYYLTLSFFASLTIILFFSWILARSAIPKLALTLLALGWLLNILAVGSVFAGYNGTISLIKFHENFRIARNCLRTKNLESPVFVDNQYLALPWMVQSDQNFVLQTSYPWDRSAGIKMESNGIGGLLDSGYFKSAIIGSSSGGRYDGSKLERYRADSELCGSLVVYRLIQ